jgi:CsoR family transcriptional regulator, copper-sensing transcriptional repressor
VELLHQPITIVAHGAVLAEQDNRFAGRGPAFLLKAKSMKIQNLEAKEKLVQRLRRIEGQVHGVQGMLDEERDCREIMQQLAAIHSAVQGASRIFLQEYATACLVEMDEGNGSQNNLDMRLKREKIIQDMIVLLDKAP